MYDKYSTTKLYLFTNDGWVEVRSGFAKMEVCYTVFY